MITRKFLLTFLLRMSGFGLMFATFAIFLPAGWMASIHEGILGSRFPDGPITVYLARSTSALYAMHGIILLLISTDVDRFFLFAKALGWVHVAFGIVITATTLLAPLPLFWTLLEGPPVVFSGSLIIWLTRRPF